MSERDKRLLIYLGAVVILAAAYFFVGSPYLDKIDALTSQKEELERELSQRQTAAANNAMYVQGINDSTYRIQKIMDMFPEDICDENSIMFTARTETAVPIWFNQVRFAEETQMMVNGGEVDSASDVEAEAMQEQIDAAEGESTQETSEEEIEAGSASTGSTGLDGLMWKCTDLSLSYETQYDGLQRFLEYMRDYEDRMVIKQIDMSYDENTGLVSGNVVIAQYAILGEDRTLPDAVTDVSSFGTPNIFLNANYGGTIIDLLMDSAADFVNVLMGGVSEGNLDLFATDYFVKVNAVTDNTNGKTIGRADDVAETTYITSDENKKEEVTFNKSGQSGKYLVSYKVGGTQYTDEIEKAEDGKIYLRVISTQRLDAADAVAVSLRVVNKSDIPVVVNIEGDDSDNPRINILEKNGNVTVNGKD